MTDVKLISFPDDRDWLEVKRRAMITVYESKPVTKAPSLEWRRRILEARHSPIRWLRFSFLFTDIPSNVSVHLCRHVHAQPYVSSLRNDRQKEMDGDKAPRDTPVNMILDVNAEELMVMANKRLCNQTAYKTREIVRTMCEQVAFVCPEMKGLLVPMCEYHGGVCHEMHPCGKC